MGEEPKQSSGDDVGAAYRKAGPYLGASSQLTGTVGALTFAGWFLDQKLGTRPWLLVAGGVVGVSLGFYLFMRVLLSIGKKQGS